MTLQFSDDVRGRSVSALRLIAQEKFVEDVEGYLYNIFTLCCMSTEGNVAINIMPSQNFNPFAPVEEVRAGIITVLLNIDDITPLNVSSYWDFLAAPDLTIGKIVDLLNEKNRHIYEMTRSGVESPFWIQRLILDNQQALYCALISSDGKNLQEIFSKGYRRNPTLGLPEARNLTADIMQGRFPYGYELSDGSGWSQWKFQIINGNEYELRTRLDNTLTTYLFNFRLDPKPRPLWYYNTRTRNLELWYP